MAREYRSITTARYNQPWSFQTGKGIFSTPIIDGDGTVYCEDGCPNDPAKTEPGICGCGTPDDDTDGDGVADCNDCCDDTIPDTPVDADGCPLGDYDNGSSLYSSNCAGCHDSFAPTLTCDNAGVCDLIDKLQGDDHQGQGGLTDQEIADLAEYFCD